MILSRSTQYAIELVLYIVTHDTENYIPLNTVAEELDLSFHFLGKIAQPLVKNKILKSYRGPFGGVALARPPSEISQYDIITAIEGQSFFTNCILRPVKCNNDHRCPIHDFDFTLRKNLEQAFIEQTMDKCTKS